MATYKIGRPIELPPPRNICDHIVMSERVCGQEDECCHCC